LTGEPFAPPRPGGTPTAAVRRFLAAVPQPAGSDADLLARYTDARDPAAFAGQVRRAGHRRTRVRERHRPLDRCTLTRARATSNPDA
jgi:hypothetical protein